MKIQAKKYMKNIIILFIVMGLWVVGYPTIRVYADAADGKATASIQVHQNFENKSTKHLQNITDTFTYQLIPLAADCPMPGTARHTIYMFDITGNSDKTIEPFVYTHAGTYQYQIQQVVEKEKPGYHYDTSVYTVTIAVKNKENNKLITEITANRGNSAKSDRIEMDNTYIENNMANAVKQSKVEHKKGKAPDTKDMSASSTWCICIAVSALAMMLLQVRKSHKKENKICK